MTNAAVNRVLPLSGVHNFRDYGGYAARDGRLRVGRLFRSGQHRNASPEDLAKIDALGLRTIIDMRGDHERATAPCARSANFRARVLFASDDKKEELAPHVEAGRAVTTADEAYTAMCAGYARMPFDPRLLRVLTHYFDALASEDGPTLVHCVAGKDRTGLAVAFCHSLLGVHRDDMLADYQLTNDCDDIEARIAVGQQGLQTAFGHQLSDAAVRLLISAQAPFLEAALQSIIERHGSVENYLAAHVGVTQDRREKIARNLLD